MDWNGKYILSIHAHTSAGSAAAVVTMHLPLSNPPVYEQFSGVIFLVSAVRAGSGTQSSTLSILAISHPKHTPSLPDFPLETYSGQLCEKESGSISPSSYNLWSHAIPFLYPFWVAVHTTFLSSLTAMCLSSSMSPIPSPNPFISMEGSWFPSFIMHDIGMIGPLISKTLCNSDSLSLNATSVFSNSSTVFGTSIPR